jgi:hypothetical protein
VPRHRSYLWLWILIAIVVVAVLWYALAGHRGSSRVGQLGVGGTVVAAAIDGAEQA